MTKKQKISEKLSRAENRGRKPIGDRRTIRVSAADWHAWGLAAEAEGLTLSEWLRRLANAAAESTRVE